MGKTVELVLKSEHCEEMVKVPADLWGRFEQRARELEICVEELFPMVLERFLKAPHPPISLGGDLCITR